MPRVQFVQKVPIVQTPSFIPSTGSLVTAPEERERLFKGLVDNSLITEARALRGGTPR